MKWRTLAYVGQLGYIGILGIWIAPMSVFALLAVLNIFWLSKR